MKTDERGWTQSTQLMGQGSASALSLLVEADLHLVCALARLRPVVEADDHGTR